MTEAGATWWSVMAADIVDAAVAGADVISLSYTNECVAVAGMICEDVKLAVDIAWDHNAVIVAATGNHGETDWIGYPAKFDKVIAVGSVDQYKSRAPSSNGGPEIDLVAPGVNIVSTAPPITKLCHVQLGYCTMSGTSMATPHVSGVVGLLRSQCPNLSNTDIVNILKSTAENLGSAGWDNLYGWGLVRADMAIQHPTVLGCQS